MQELFHGTARVAPVSYTHLDVYKRQVHVLAALAAGTVGIHLQILVQDLNICLLYTSFPTSSGRGPGPRAPGEWNERRDAFYAILHARADSEPSGARNSYRKI